ncbi:hypothetical protein TPA0598_04_03660 [Streptomyces lydicamycinicus]|uniref:Uncharacterized protein n=1 Tax=Streptomyces lydicamycinicus TaxID=1546107 RepID=A0A0P4R795_9ACTN|nr:hypothetical protein [Streptomyces lydicamycinicus]GAO08730.1 hypothetical protein TPA0598_04_03660 [Streptomyces lydicamycinicus]
MNAEDFKGDPADRELYLRLLVERDGPPINALIERDPDLKVRRGPDLEAERHCAEIEAAMAPKRLRRASA